VWRGVVCGTVWCVVRCGVWRGVVCGAVWCVAQCGVWCGVVCGVVWCVARCGVCRGAVCGVGCGAWWREAVCGAVCDVWRSVKSSFFLKIISFSKIECGQALVTPVRGVRMHAGACLRILLKKIKIKYMEGISRCVLV